MQRHDPGFTWSPYRVLGWRKGCWLTALLGNMSKLGTPVSDFFHLIIVFSTSHNLKIIIYPILVLLAVRRMESKTLKYDITGVLKVYLTMKAKWDKQNGQRLFVWFRNWTLATCTDVRCGEKATCSLAEALIKQIYRHKHNCQRFGSLSAWFFFPPSWLPLHYQEVNCQRTLKKAFTAIAHTLVNCMHISKGLWLITVDLMRVNYEVHWHSERWGGYEGAQVQINEGGKKEQSGVMGAEGTCHRCALSWKWKGKKKRR